jgi:hypothetical protein
MKYKITNIKWDTDEDELIFESLPQKVEITVTDEDDIADALSDEYGFCVFGFDYVEIA